MGPDGPRAARCLLACALLAGLPARALGLERACVPLLHLASYLNGSQAAARAPEAPPTAAERTLSFAVGDFELPVLPSEGSLGSAVRLLARFGGPDFEDNSDDAHVDHPDDEQPDWAPDESGNPGEPPNTVRFRHNRFQARGLNLTLLKLQLHAHAQPRLEMGLRLANATLSGQFVGSLPLLTDSRLAGHFRMSVEGFRLRLAFNLSSRQLAEGAGRALQAADLQLNLTELGYIRVQILDGPEPDQATASYLLQLLQSFLQRTIKRTYFLFEAAIHENLQREARRALDCELSRFTPLINQHKASALLPAPREPAPPNGTRKEPEEALEGDLGAAQGQQLNDLALILSDELASAQLSRVKLPDFEHSQSLLAGAALIRFRNGSLAGLHQVRLQDQSRLELQDGQLVVNASLAWSELRPRYDWSLHLGANATGPPSGSGFVAFNVKALELEALLRRQLSPGARLRVERLTVRRLEGPRADIGGLPGLNRITRALVNFLVGRLKGRLAAALEAALREQLERSLNRISWLQ